MWQLPHLLFTQDKEAEVTAFGQCCGAGTRVLIPFATNNPAFQWESPLLQFSPESYVLAPSLILHSFRKEIGGNFTGSLSVTDQKHLLTVFQKNVVKQIRKSKVQIGQNEDLETGFPVHGE